MQNINLKSIIETDRNFALLSTSANHVLHAIAVIGVDSYYSKEFCKALICKILIASKRDDLAKKVEHGSFIDLIEFDGEESIKVADISQIVEKSYEKGIESDQKFCIINNAQRMTTEAQNKLLKTLEEPSLGQYFFLCIPSRFLLLPTILSRCTIIELPTLEKQQIKKVLEDNHLVQDNDEYVELSLGSISNISESPTILQESFEIAFRALTQIVSSANIVEFSLKIQKSEIELVIRYLEQLIDDCLKIKNNISNIWFESKKSTLKNLDFSQKGLIFVYKEIQKIKQNAKFNVSQTVLADKLTLAIAEGKHKND